MFHPYKWRIDAPMVVPKALRGEHVPVVEVRRAIDPGPKAERTPEETERWVDEVMADDPFVWPEDR